MTHDEAVRSRTPSDAAVGRYRPWLHILAIALVIGTFGLVAIGGFVTTTGSGLAVPDGWMTFDHFTPFAPLHTWWDDIGTRWEHSHRLKGYVVGGLTLAVVGSVLATQRRRKWLVGASFALLGMVILQGVMGALRVDAARITPGEGYVAATGVETLASNILRIVHGIFGQLVLGTTVLIAAALGPTWQRLRLAATPELDASPRLGKVRYWTLALLLALVMQLTLGAIVRHEGAGLAIPDFPLAYGQLVPPLTQDGITAAQARLETQNIAVMPTTPDLVLVHFLHRLGAVVVTIVAIGTLITVFRNERRRPLAIPATVFSGLLVLQWLLAMYTIWTARDPIITTCHQVVGALLLAVGVWISIRAHLLSRTPAADREPAGSPTAVPRGVPA